MSKLGCTCGGVMRDQTDFIPYKARILADEDTQQPAVRFAQAVAGLVQAREQGREALRAFLIRYLSEPEGGSAHLPQLNHSPESAAEWVDRWIDLDDLAAVIYEVIFPQWWNYPRDIFECEECGRLWVEVEDHRFVPYRPETERRHVLWSRYHHGINPLFHEADETEEESR